MTLLSVSCREIDESPEAVFTQGTADFLHGNLSRSQEEAHRGYETYRKSSQEWAWKFRLLEAKAALWRGLNPDVVHLLQAEPPSETPDFTIERLTLVGVASVNTHSLADAERFLLEADKLCSAHELLSCGYVLQGRGLLASELNQSDNAEQMYERALAFSRSHGDKFLEANSLLNLGAESLSKGRYDEAVNRSEAANELARRIGARIPELVTECNIGWAYYKLGDSERALELCTHSGKMASELTDIYDQENALTNIGYVHMDAGEFSLAASSFQSALSLAQKIDVKQDIFNATRVLARLSVQTGDFASAERYADQALEIARGTRNRADELYPILVQGQIAARRGDKTTAETIFHEIEHDKVCPVSLKWEAEHDLAQLHEDDKRPNYADREYRSALATFEAARDTVRREDSRLSFLTNASRIYDDYIHFLIVRGRPDDALGWADYSRARTLADGLGLLTKGSSSGRPPLHPQQIAQQAGGTLLLYWLGERQSYLWAITPQKSSLFTLPPRAEIEAAAQRYRKAVVGPQDVLQSADSDGQALYRMLVAPAQGLLKKDAKVFVIPDGSLNNLNFETLLAPGSDAAHSKLHYWIEDVALADASSLRVLGTIRTSKPADKLKRDAALLVVGNSVAPNKSYPELPKAAAQVESVARHFPAATKKILTREHATPAAYLSSNPEQFSYIHFVAHGTASRLSPLDSAIVLSKTSPSKGDTEDNSFKLYARDIIQHPLRAELVTISACYGAGERAYSGEGLVGLSWAFVRTGAHHVVAALWEATDSSTERLMDKFYDELDKGADPGTALRAAKLSLLHDSPFENPFYWAPFQLYVGSSSPNHK
jgi:CHAT domain-containing protein